MGTITGQKREGKRRRRKTLEVVDEKDAGSRGTEVGGEFEGVRYVKDREEKPGKLQIEERWVAVDTQGKGNQQKKKRGRNLLWLARGSSGGEGDKRSKI